MGLPVDILQALLPSSLLATFLTHRFNPGDSITCSAQTIKLLILKPSSEYDLIVCYTVCRCPRKFFNIKMQTFFILYSKIL